MLPDAFQIRVFLDGNSAQFPNTPILVASEGLPRIEFFRDEALIDTMYVEKFSAEALTDLLVEMGEERDVTRSWESLKAERELFEAFMPNFDEDL